MHCKYLVTYTERPDEGQAREPAEQSDVWRGDYAKASARQIERGLAGGLQAVLRTAVGIVTNVVASWSDGIPIDSKSNLVAILFWRPAATQCP